MLISGGDVWDMRDTHCRRWALVFNDHSAKIFSDRVVDNNVFVGINTDMYIGKWGPPTVRRLEAPTSKITYERHCYAAAELVRPSQ